MTPKRYDCGTMYDGGVMDEAEAGEFVTYADYEALAEEVNALRKTLRTPLLTQCEFPYGQEEIRYGLTPRLVEEALMHTAIKVAVYYGETHVFASMAAFADAISKEEA